MLFDIKRPFIQTEASLAIRSKLSRSLVHACVSALYPLFVEEAEKFGVWRSLSYSLGTNVSLKGLLS